MKRTKEEEEKIQSHLREGNISLIIESYNDLFSDFDPRPYDQRALSDDFLSECKNAVRSKAEDYSGFELRFLIPKAKRNLNDEEKIKKRLSLYFEKHYLETLVEIKQTRKNGIFFIVLGAVLTLFGALLTSKEGLLFNILTVIIEPAGWFTIWNGFDRVLLEPRKKAQEHLFYKKMTHLDIKFHPY